MPDQKINGKQHYLWRAVDQDGEVVDVYLQAKRDGAAAKRLFRSPLRSYGVAHRELMPDVIHDKSQYANNRAEQSHEATRARERVIRGPASRGPAARKFKSVRQAQRFLGAHAAVSNLLNLGRYLVRALRVSAFTEWGRAVA